MTEAFEHDALAVVLQVRADRLCVLLWLRAQAPEPGRWALPGGPLRSHELLGASVARHLAENVDVDQVAHLEQLETRSDPDRDPRGRRLATAYLGLVPIGQEPLIPPDSRWHPIDELPSTAFDHGSIIASARSRLRSKLSYTTIAVALAPPQFSMSQLRTIYSAALGYEVSATNLQRVLLRRNALEPTTDQAHPGPAGGRPARLYRFTQAVVQVTDPFAVLRPPD